MTCAEAMELLDDYVDGELSEARFQEVELHLAGCPGCRDEERRLRAVLAHAAALPREAAPERDLWPEIAERIRPRPRLVLLKRVPMLAPLAMAAAVLVAVVGTVMVARRQAAPPPFVASIPATAQPVSLGGDPAHLLEAERQYDRATSELLAALNARRETLSPATITMVEQNLRSIDQALAEIRAALRQDPASPELNHLLTSTHQKKLDVLQQVMRLGARL
jgi:predicted anti-sigma-YlaC factor YlaD